MNISFVPTNLNPGANSCTISIRCEEKPIEIKWCKEKDYPEKMVQVQDGQKLHITRNGVYCIKIRTEKEHMLAKFSLFHLRTIHPFSGGDGSLKNPYLIETCAQFNQIRANLNAHFRIIRDLDFGASLGSLSWVPIGQYRSKSPPLGGETSSDSDNLCLCNIENYGFIGELDGNGHTISGLNCSYLGKKWIGLFGSCGNGAYIHDLFIDHFNISSLGAQCIAGTVVGIASNSLIERCVITNTIVQSGLTAGGISGYAENTKFRQCQFHGMILLDNSCYTSAGGIFGDVGKQGNAHPYCEDCCVKADICGADDVGGIANGPTFITRCFFSGKLSGRLYVGGITSKSMLSIIQDCVCADCRIICTDKVDGTYQWGHFVTFCNNGGQQICTKYIEKAWRNHVGRVRCDDHLLLPDSSVRENYCTDSSIMQTKIQIVNPVDGSRRDGRTIPCNYSNKASFYKGIGWDFDTIWEIGSDGLPQIRCLKNN